MSQSRFIDVPVAPQIEIFALNDAYNEDKHPQKVSLGIGAYRTNEGKPWVLPVVQEAEKQMVNDRSLNHEYLPITGSPEFITASANLALGSESPAIKEERYGGVQCIGGTGAIFVGAAFLRRNLGASHWYMSNPTWANHRGIAKHLGYEIHEYRYLDSVNHCLDIDGLLEDLSNAPSHSVIVLHTCAHNPTGYDPTREQWQQIADVCKEKSLFPFFDCAYQGFATGDLDSDAFALRLFVQQKFEIFVAQSFSKNFGLYNERVGCLLYVVSDKSMLGTIAGQMKIVCRTTYSNPPNHGARIVSKVLGDSTMYENWTENVKIMAHRIIDMRTALFNELIKLGTPGTWTHITTQIGMFSYTGLNALQVQHLRDRYHIYLLSSGRISMCGLTTDNVQYVAEAMDDAVRNIIAKI